MPATKNLTVSKYNDTFVDQLVDITTPRQELILDSGEDLTDYTVTVLHGNLDIHNSSLKLSDEDYRFKIAEIPELDSLQNFRSVSDYMNMSGNFHGPQDFCKVFSKYINDWTIGESPEYDLNDSNTYPFLDPVVASDRLLDFEMKVNEDGSIVMTMIPRLRVENNATYGIMVSYLFYQKFLTGLKDYLVYTPSGSSYVTSSGFVVLKPFKGWNFTEASPPNSTQGDPYKKKGIMTSIEYDLSKFYNWSRVIITSDTLPVPQHLFYQEGQEYLTKMNVISSILINSEALDASRKLLYIPDTLREVSLEQNRSLYNLQLGVYIQYENGLIEQMVIRPTTSVSIQLQFKKRS